MLQLWKNGKCWFGYEEIPLFETKAWKLPLNVKRAWVMFLVCLLSGDFVLVVCLCRPYLGLIVATVSVNSLVSVVSIETQHRLSTPPQIQDEDFQEFPPHREAAGQCITVCVLLSMSWPSWSPIWQRYSLRSWQKNIYILRSGTSFCLNFQITFTE